MESCCLDGIQLVCLAHGGIKPELHADDIIFEVILIEILPNNAAMYRPFIYLPVFIPL